MGYGAVEQQPSLESANEYVAAAVHAAQVWADHEVFAISRLTESSEVAVANNLQSREAVLEADNEREMLCFLLDDTAAWEALVLLEQELDLQPPLIGRRLRQYHAELGKRCRAS